LKGVVRYYPKQDPEQEPKSYPWAIAMRGKNPAVLDVELLNPYNGIHAAQNERHLIRNVSGQPLHVGIWVDDIWDIGRIENVHFNPWWSMQPKLLDWQMRNGQAFVFGRSDWQYVLNTFCYGYWIGYRFIATQRGVCNGNFVGIGADDCYTALVVDQCAPIGWERASRYRIYKKTVGVDSDLDFILEGLPANSSTQVVIAALNDGG
jgi:hypothetical protein